MKVVVEYEVKVYCEVDLDTNEIIRVVQDESVEPTDEPVHVIDEDGGYLADTVNENLEARARAIADEQTWPAWEQGY